MIGITSMPLFAPDYDAVGNPSNPSYIPSALLPFSDRMTFFEHLYDTIYVLRVKHFFYNNILPRHQELVDRNFGYFIPKLEELHINVSAVFVNYDNSFHHPIPEVPYCCAHRRTAHCNARTFASSKVKIEIIQ
ncbi:hypothetical protein PR048_019598 [Dryococelus australis]|uniref:Uncharacterized protein n=1 Tax=Dryococelus australis TaxID=614101 RepID=A0ABQ9H3Z2_9NEOP|nr:hypothetical protein PR048_019598 [Dryococelus australis]